MRRIDWMAGAARLATGIEPVRVDVLAAKRGFMSFGVEFHYVFYDAQDRVLISFGQFID
jgi:hypothetical protein